MGTHPCQASQVQDDFKANIIIVVKFSIYLCTDHHFPRCVPLYLSTHPLFFFSVKLLMPFKVHSLSLAKGEEVLVNREQLK